MTLRRKDDVRGTGEQGLMDVLECDSVEDFGGDIVDDFGDDFFDFSGEVVEEEAEDNAKKDERRSYHSFFAVASTTSEEEESLFKDLYCRFARFTRRRSFNFFRALSRRDARDESSRALRFKTL